MDKGIEGFSKLTKAQKIEWITRAHFKNPEDSLWSGKYNADRLESIRSMKDGKSYTILKNFKETNATQIVQFYYKNSKQGNVVLDSDNHKEIENFSNYTFSKNEKKILLESNVIPIYRRSKAADYWVFDIATKVFNFFMVIRI